MRIPKDAELTLKSEDTAAWVNETGYATSILVDLQALFACIKAASATAWTGDDKMFASDLVKAPLSTRFSLILRNNPFLKPASSISASSVFVSA